MTNRIIELSKKYHEDVVALRHHFHMYPEIGFEEYETSKVVAEKLKELKIEIKRNVANTGVVGLIKGGKPGKTVLLRADMDALLLQEEADVPYKSIISGKMHGCGHDGHTAGLLGAAMILNEMKDELCGNVKLAFQPNEENEGGALLMIEEGVLKNPKVDAAFGCHVWGSIKEGKVEVKHGAVMASPDEFKIKIIGRGGHAALPHLSIDPVVIAAEVVSQFQTIISRRLNPLVNAVLSVTYLHAGETHNVIPNEVDIMGTIRTFDTETRKWIPEVMETIVRKATESYGATYKFEVEKRFPPLINDDDMTDLVMKSLSKIVGDENVSEAENPSMGGEDFAYFAANVPSSFYFVGIAPSDEEIVSHHNPKFAWDDKNLLIVSQTLAQTAVDFLNRQ